MKEFVDGLSKYGYEVLPRHDYETDKVFWYVMCIRVDDTEKEQPELLVACVYEIDRLGWNWELGFKRMGGFPEGMEDWGFTVYFSNRGTVVDVRVPLAAPARTATKACRNALIAALEAK